MDKLEQHIADLQAKMEDARSRQDDRMFEVFNIRYQESVAIRKMMKG